VLAKTDNQLVFVGGQLVDRCRWPGVQLVWDGKEKGGLHTIPTKPAKLIRFFQGCGKDVAESFGYEGKNLKEHGEGQGQRHGHVEGERARAMFGLLELSTDNIRLQFPNFFPRLFHLVLIAGPTMDSQSLSKIQIYLRL